MTALAPRVRRTELHGHLRLVCDVDREGRSYLREQSFSVPFHLSKPFLDHGVLVVNAVNPTAGLLRGDATQSDIWVRPGARLLLTTPSATRVHDTQDGSSETIQHFSVSAGGWLEVLPELLIPQRGARHRQRTSIEIEQFGGVLFLEMLAPGRVAMGESFAFQELDWRTEIRLEGRLIAREKFVLSPRNGSLRALRKAFAHPYLATFFIVTDRLAPGSPCWGEIDSLHGPGLWVGASRLAAGGWVVKIIAEGSSRLRAAVATIREMIFRAADLPSPNLRKL